MEPGDIVGTHFEIIEHHASGGMGAVYRGRNAQSGEAVAIKVVSVPTDVELGRFDREVDMLATLEHPGIVRYIAHGSLAAAERYLVQEWIEGATLHNHLSSVGITGAEALSLVGQVADALAEAHALGIVHRDIKPNNLIIESESPHRVRLLDFGLARLTEANDRVTRTGTAVGTPGYMSPEQILGKPNIGAEVDVFALGCVLYRALSGHHPFAGRDPAAVRTKILMCDPPALDRLCGDVSLDLAGLVAEMLNKDVSKRPPDGAAVSQRIANLISRGELPTRRVFGAAASAEATLALPTAVIGGTHVAVVMLRDLSRDELKATKEETERMRGSLSAALSAFRGQVQILDTATVVFRIDGDRAACAQRALRAAVVLSSLTPNAGIAVSVGLSSDLGGAVESASKAAESAGLKQLFAPETDHASGLIYVDPDTATLLPAPFTTEFDGSYHRVRASGQDQGDA